VYEFKASNSRIMVIYPIEQKYFFKFFLEIEHPEINLISYCLSGLPCLSEPFKRPEIYG
jgi:hypothetical protein